MDCNRELKLKHEGTDIYQSYGVWICFKTYSPSKSNNSPTGSSISGFSSSRLNNGDVSSLNTMGGQADFSSQIRNHVFSAMNSIVYGRIENQGNLRLNKDVSRDIE